MTAPTAAKGERHDEKEDGEKTEALQGNSLSSGGRGEDDGVESAMEFAAQLRADRRRKTADDERPEGLPSILNEAPVARKVTREVVSTRQEPGDGEPSLLGVAIDRAVLLGIVPQVKVSGVVDHAVTA